MADVFTKEKRSEVMSKIRGRDTKIEISFRKALWKEGFRFRKNYGKYYGKPDLVLKKYKTVVFLDSCFWHCCKKHFIMPKSNKPYWEKKINRNQERDSEVNRHYRREGWHVVRIWEHDLKKTSNFEKTLVRVKNKLQANLVKISSKK